MKKKEVLDLLSQKKLTKVKIENRVTEYIDGDKLYYDGVFHNRTNVYGVFHDIENGSYNFFITNDERFGMIVYNRDFSSEDEAFTALYTFVDRASHIFNK